MFKGVEASKGVYSRFQESNEISKKHCMLVREITKQAANSSIIVWTPDCNVISQEVDSDSLLIVSRFGLCDLFGPRGHYQIGHKQKFGKHLRFSHENKPKTACCIIPIACSRPPQLLVTWVRPSETNMAPGDQPGNCTPMNESRWN